MSNAITVVGGLLAGAKWMSGKLTDGTVSSATSWVTDLLGGDRAGAVALLLVGVGLLVRIAVAGARWQRRRSAQPSGVTRQTRIVAERPTAAPASALPVRRASVPMPFASIAGAASPDALRAALERELEEGRRLAHTALRLRGVVNVLGLPGVESDVAEWEKRVAHHLNRAERWDLADDFLADPPQPPASTTLPPILPPATPGFEDPFLLERRVDFRVTQLNTIVKRKL